MKFFLYILFFLTVGFGFAQQNLIYNGSFEEFTACPDNIGQIELINGWWNPNAGSSDYFNSCNQDNFGVPTNLWGYENAYEGQAYVGVGQTEWNSNGIYFGNEYIQCELKEALVPCYEYHFTMYVSLADNSTHGISRIGALFTDDTFDINLPNWDAILFEPQLINHSGIIIDTTNWTKIEGTFVANDYSKFLTIGYFASTVTNDTIFVQDSPFLNSSVAYYFIDSISLLKIGHNPIDCNTFAPEIPNIFTPNNDHVNDSISIENFIFSKPEMVIFNRWGQAVCNLDEIKFLWDGKCNNEDCEEGIYFYRLVYQSNNGEETKSGYIHLIRN